MHAFKLQGRTPQAKTEECDQKRLNSLDQFSTTIACSVTHFLDVSARESLKVATKVSIRDKKIFACFCQEKTKKCDEKVLNVFD